MTVILVTQETGSHGDEVAARIAACLGLELVPQERIEQRVTERMQISKSTVRHLLQGTASLGERRTISRHRLVRHMAAEVVNLATRGNAVFQSWGATAQLRPVRHVICVHVCAPAGQSMPAPAMALCCRSQPRHWMRPSQSAEKCDDVGCYDLVLNTKRISVDECVEQVRRLVHRSQFKPTPDSRVLLASLVPQTSARTAPVLEVDVDGDTIRLPTGASNEEAIARVEQHLRGKTVRGGLAALGSWPMTQQGIL